MNVATPEVSVVIPIYNEEPNLRELIPRVIAAMEATGRSFELIAVDDGSRDGSLEVLKKFRATDDRMRVLVLTRNFGQNQAMYAGFAHVRGNYVVTLDADLQNPPEEVNKILAKLDEGYDVVNGWRGKRRDSLFRQFASKILNFIVSRITKVRLRDYGCNLKGYRREIVDKLLKFTHLSRYLPVDTAWLGANITEVEVAHSEREKGDSKYGLFRLLKTYFDLLCSITAAPIQFIGFMGWVFALVGFAMGIRIVYYRFAVENFTEKTSQLGIVAAMFFFLVGIQMIATGLMCEYISRIYIEVQGKPYYIVKEIIE